MAAMSLPIRNPIDDMVDAELDAFKEHIILLLMGYLWSNMFDSCGLLSKKMWTMKIIKKNGT